MSNLNGTFKSDEPVWVRLEIKGKTAILETKGSMEHIVISKVLRFDHDEGDIYFWYEVADKEKLYGMHDLGEEIAIKRVQNCNSTSFEEGALFAKVEFYEV